MNLRAWRTTVKSESEIHSVMSDSLRPPWTWNSPGPNTGVGSLSLLQGILPTQGLNSGLPHCRLILYQLSPNSQWDLKESAVTELLTLSGDGSPPKYCCVLPMLSSGSFIVSSLTFRSLIHFETFFLYRAL